MDVKRAMVIPMVNSFPMLAIPTWGETARFPKLQMVVRVLKKMPRAVLV